MQQLDKHEYLQLLGDPAEAFEVTPDAAGRVVRYANQVWPTLKLQPRKLTRKDLAHAYRHGAHEKCLFHVRAYPRRMPETFVIIVGDAQAQNLAGHLLIDLSAETSPPWLDCPSFEFKGTPNHENLERFLRGIHPDDDNPFAVLKRGDGTYMQTYRIEDGYVLEHQLVNTSSHYGVSKPVSADEVVAAMLSYAFGDNEWVNMFAWPRQKLD